LSKTTIRKNPIHYRPGFQILRGQEYGSDPCPTIQKIAAQSYGSSTALPLSLLRRWYNQNPEIFKIALVSNNVVAGYLSSLPLIGKRFDQTIDPEFKESTIKAGDIDSGFYPAKGGVFISSIAVAREYQEQSPASILLRLAFVEDLIAYSSGNEQSVRISAQVLSPKGEACMRSLGLRERGSTDTGWRIYFARLEKTELQSVHRELQRKLERR
jgi:hypothetical protein